MVVSGPEVRDAFMPRALPATCFGPADRVSGGYVVYRDGKLKVNFNVQTADLTAEEIVYVKGNMVEWAPPYVLQDPPADESWDAAKVDLKPRKQKFNGQNLLLRLFLPRCNLK